jgi:hypothetical protein
MQVSNSTGAGIRFCQERQNSKFKNLDTSWFSLFYKIAISFGSFPIWKMYTRFLKTGTVPVLFFLRTGTGTVIKVVELNLKSFLFYPDLNESFLY